MSRPIAFRWVLLTLALALLPACANDSGEWVMWADKAIYIPAGYELGETGSGNQRQGEEGQHTEEGSLFVWAEIVEAATGDIVGVLICEQFSCLRSPLSYTAGDHPVAEAVMQQIAAGARELSDDCDPLKEPCEED